jgi:PPM family protein phosphatase
VRESDRNYNKPWVTIAVSAVYPSTSSLEIAAKTDAGMLRSLNEDSIATVSELGLLVLADGMGGYTAGDIASNLATRTITDVLTMGLRDNPDSDVATLVRRAVKIANGMIFQEGLDRAQRPNVKQDEAMGSTVALLLFRNDRVTIAHVGDSRVYRLREHCLELMTHDHSLLQEQIDLGILSAENAGTSHNRHLVTRGLGIQATVVATLEESAALPGDIFLLCSDGLNDMVDNADIELVLNSLQANLPLAASQLVMLANDNGGDDNISVILARVTPHPASAVKKTGFLARFFGR